MKLKFIQNINSFLFNFHSELANYCKLCNISIKSINFFVNNLSENLWLRHLLKAHVQIFKSHYPTYYAAAGKSKWNYPLQYTDIFTLNTEPWLHFFLVLWFVHMSVLFRLVGWLVRLVLRVPSVILEGKRHTHTHKPKNGRQYWISKGMVIVNWIQIFFKYYTLKYMEMKRVLHL